VGVGEATIPAVGRPERILGFDEHEYCSRQKRFIKLGALEFALGHLGELILHTFGDAGINLQSIRFTIIGVEYAATVEGSIGSGTIR